jgi:hypothetical protein
VTRERPCSAAEAVKRALSVAGRGGQYLLGSGDYRPRFVDGTLVDLPWTPRDGRWGSDCAGFAQCWSYKIVRHHPGFAKGGPVEDDHNTDSAVWDARHRQEVYEVITRPEIGALVVTPTIRLPRSEQLPTGFYRMGHVRITVTLGRVAEWDEDAPQWELLDFAEACGPSHRAPGVILTTGAGVKRHDGQWSKPEHKAVMLRVRR